MNEEPIIAPVNNRRELDRLRGLAQWLSSHGKPCSVIHECNSLRVYVDGIGKQYRRPTFRQVREIVFGGEE